MSSTKVKPIYVLHGTDVFLRDAHRREVIAQVIGQADPQLCVSSFDATAELADVLDELRTTPLLAQRRAVVVRDAGTFVSAHRKALEKYLLSPSQRASLILIVASWPTNTLLYKRVKEIGEAIDCSVPERVGLARWLKDAAAKRGKKISPEAAELLEQCTGRDFAALDSEVEKLSLYLGDRETITAEDVQAVVTATAGPVAFALSNAITAGDAAAALKALGGILTRPEDVFKTLGSIRWHLRRVLAAQQLIDGGASPAKAVPWMPPPQKAAFAAMLKRRPLSTLQKDFRWLLQADLAIKSGTDGATALQKLVVELCS